MFKRFLAIVAIVALMLAAPWLLSQLPIRTHSFLEEAAPPFSGVITIGVAQNFRAGQNGNLTWLEKCVAHYEKVHPGVKIVLRQVIPSLAQAVLQGTAPGDVPDILLFSPGVINSPEALLTPLSYDNDTIIGAFLQSAYVGDTLYALPLAAGSYALLANSAYLKAAQAFIAPQEEQAPADYLSTLLNALSQVKMRTKVKSDVIACPTSFDGSGLLALCTTGTASDAQIKQGRWDKLWGQFVLDQSYAIYVGTQREITRMAQLQANGAAFDWEVLPTLPTYCDQVLYGALPKNSNNEDTPARAACLKLLNYLTGAQAQGELSQSGLFSIASGITLYTEESPLHTLEEGLRAQHLIVPNAYSYSFSSLPKTAEEAQRALQQLK